MATFVATLNGLRARLGVRDRRRDRGTRLLIEALEDRRLLSVSPLAQAAASLVLRPNFNTSALTAGAAHSAVLLDPAAAAAQIAAHPHPSALPAAAEIAKGTVPFSPNENWDSPLLVASPTVKAAATPGIAASGAASSATVYSTGFESSEGFTAGFLGTQNGWNTFAGDATQPAVAVGSPFDGSQYLQVGNDAKVAAGGLVGGFSPDFGSQSAGTYVVSANLLVNQPTNPLKFMGGSNYYVAVLGDSQGDITADICFYHELNQGYVFVLTNVGSQVQWTYTGWTWGPDSPIQVTIAIDATTNQINYYGNGYALFRGAVWSIPAAEQIVLYDDNLNSADGVTAAYDDLDVSRTLLIPARAAAWWDDKIVVSNTTGTNTDDVLYPSDSLYVDWAVKNVGDAPAAAFWTSVYVDGAPEKTWQTPAGVLSGDFFTVTDFDLGPLAVGIHQIAIIPDTTADGVAPADAWLNEYVKSITVNPFGEIQGTIWNDANANGTWDSGETAASGATVYLDLNHNGLRDPGEPSTTTDANGSYTFTGLRDGNYVVAVDSGSQSSYQENGTGYPSGAVGTSTATVAAGQVSHLPPVGVPFVLQGRLAESRSAGVGATAGAASAKGTVPFSSNENWDSPPLAPAPASFDLRTLNDVTPIEDQGALGGCWAFATYAALESAILVEGGPATTFSENNLKDYHRFDYWPNGGGFDVNMSRAYLSRGSGPINASDSPYYDWDDMPAPGGTPQYYVRDSLTFDTPERIKQALMTYGALTTDMYFDSSAFNASDNTYYYSGSQEANHAVAIVGWDDNKVTAAAAPGAWLIKNSWGAAWGDRGYFWISYSDTVAAQTATAYINAVPASSYDHIYYYDEYGEVEDINATDAFNAFTAGSSQDLKSVQFYTTADNAGYQVNVYSSFSGGVLSGLLGTVSGTCDDPGYHTVDLPSQVPLAAGQKFYVALHLDNGGQFPMAISMKLAGYSSNATSQPGESYYFDAGQWTDLATFDPTANLTIKALTVDAADPGTLAVSLAPGAQATAQNLGVSPPPTATLSNSGPVNMGGTATVSFSQPTDPSATAAAAGFHYAYAFTSDGRFDIGDGTYAGSVTAASATVPAADLADGPATLLVHARIIDQDGRFTDYTTTITILYVAPTAVNDSYNTLENVPLSVTAAAGVLANDYEPGGYTLSMAPVTLPAHGQLHWAADGAFTYQPNQYFSGADSFTYQAVDGVGRSNVARVTINVTPVNQAPSFTPGGNVTVKEDSGEQQQSRAVRRAAGRFAHGRAFLHARTVCPRHGHGHAASERQRRHGQRRRRHLGRANFHHHHRAPVPEFRGAGRGRRCVALRPAHGAGLRHEHRGPDHPVPGL
ncbi:MAG: lectin like domain-containing protein [Thermoguttaceae bacterium]